MTDYNVRAAVGQAYNLAAQDAITKGREEDTRYIIARFLFHRTLASQVQDNSEKELLQAVMDDSSQLNTVLRFIKDSVK